jgi:hypothetical protein
MKKTILFILLINIVFLTSLLWAAPDAVTDLKVEVSGFKHTKLSWTTPYDVASDTTPSYYELRFSTFNPITSNLTWDNNSTQTFSPYRIIFSTGNITKGKKVYCTIAGLTNGLNHYFAIKSSTDNISGHWSSIDSNGIRPIAAPFNTPPSTSVSLDLISNTTNTFTPKLSWTVPSAGSDDANYGDTIAGYYVELSTSQNFVYKITQDNIATNSWKTYSLSENTTYWWHVKAKDSEGTYSASFAASKSFIVNAVNEAPLPFDLNGPPNGYITSVDQFAAPGIAMPNFTWHSTTDPDPGDYVKYYTVYYSTASNFNVKVTTHINILANSYQPTHDLIENATYYWKVHAVDSHDKYRVSNSTWIVRINKTTEPPPPVTLISPSNDAIVSTSTPVLAWNKVIDPNPGGNVTYIVLYSSFNTNPATSPPIGNLTTGQYRTAALVEDATYWWQVQATNGLSSQSSIWKFHVNALNSPPNLFNLLIGSGTITSRTPVLKWQQAKDPDNNTVTYTVYYSKMLDFSVLSSSQGLSNTSFTPSQLLDDNATYYWKVEAMDSHSAVTRSGIWTLIINTVPDPPADFALLSPVDSEKITTRQAVFQWQKTTDPDPFDYVSSYSLYYSTNASFNTGTIVPNIKLSSYTLTTNTLIEDTTYYWKVRAVAKVSGTTDSLIRSFIVSNHAPFAFDYISSSGIVKTNNVPLSWQSAVDPENDAVTYTVYYSSFSDLRVYKSSSGLSATGYTIANLTNNVTYYWYANVSDIRGNTKVQSNKIWSFNVSYIADPPIAFNLIHPVNGAKLSGLTTYLSWQNTRSPNINTTVSYTLWYSTNPQFNSNNILNKGTSTFYQFADNLAFATTYYWRVYALASNGKQTVSDTWQFTTITRIKPAVAGNFKTVIDTTKTKVTLSWDAVTKNSDGTVLTNLKGYKIYRAYSFDSIYTVGVTTYIASGTLSWTDQKLAGQTVYYVMKAYNAFDVESDFSDFKAVSDSNLDLIYPSDQSMTVSFAQGIIPSTMTVTVLRLNNGSNSDVLGYYQVMVKDSSLQTLNYTFKEPFTLRFRQSSFSPAIKKAISLGSTYVGVYWYNGVVWTYIGGQDDNGDIIVKTPYIGYYQLRKVQATNEFKTLNIWPKIITPNGDGINDSFNCTFENSTSNSVEGNIYDLNGAHVANMVFLTNTWLVWDGTDEKASKAAPGIYLYQIKCGTKVINGTVVVAR